MHPFQLSGADLNIIREKVKEKKTLAQGRNEALFNVFKQTLSPEEEVALQFLYAFLPLVDLADYSGDLFLKHVRHSLKAINEAPWGHRITGELFLHYVLPYRISNEVIEEYRPYFWKELYDRVKGFSMAKAILEINHWCHEKATYIAADPRTCSPLTLIRTARGRCGEESALLVAALRSLGIPARQVYAPRWAHTDSNHAWVEAWADEAWYFLGACEPEPHLNMGWFADPARRAMFIHTRVPGTIYGGPEEKVQAKDGYTEINLLSSYAPSQCLTVQVCDENGATVAGANVEFQVFNYGGFASLTCLLTDEKGEASLTTGLGDLWIHAFTEQAWGSTLAKADGPRKVNVVLGSKGESFIEFVMNIPPELPGESPVATPKEREENNRRLKEEDEIRATYEATFLTQEKAEQLAAELDIDPLKVWTVLERARGNSHEIASFLEKGVPIYGPIALELAYTLSAKDLTDTTSAILEDHLAGALIYEGIYPEEEFIHYVLQPRVSLEVVRPYREFFQSVFTLGQQEIFTQNPQELKIWIERHITTVPDGVVRGWPTPQGIFELRVGNTFAKKILFVAMARSFGIAARLAPVDGRSQYLHEEEWLDVEFSKGQEEIEGTGILRFHKAENYQGKLDYYQNFSVARLENQVFQTLRFKGLDEEAFDEQSFSHRLEVGPGIYRLTTGNRLADGRVFVTLTHFSLKAGEEKDVEVVLASEKRKTKNLGQLPPHIVLPKYVDGEQLAVDKYLTKQGVVLAWIEPNREPTKHLVRDLCERKEQLDALGIPILLCLGSEKVTDSFDIANYQHLPENTIFIRDDHYKIWEEVQRRLTENMPRSFPMVVVGDNKGIIRYTSTGYQIGTGAHILDSLTRME